MKTEQIGELANVTAKLEAGERAEILHEKRLKLGDLVMVRRLYTEGPGYEAKVVRILGEKTTRGGTHAWRYVVEPTGRVKKIVAYFNHGKED